MECGGLEIRTFAVAASSASVTLSVFARKAVNVLGRAVYEQTVTVLGPNSHRRVGGKTGSRLIWETRGTHTAVFFRAPFATRQTRRAGFVSDNARASGFGFQGAFLGCFRGKCHFYRPGRPRFDSSGSRGHGNQKRCPPRA